MYSFTDAIILCLLLSWNLVSPSFKVRAFQSGRKQGLKSLGGILHSLSLILSLLSFVVVSVMLGYKTVYLAPVPLIVTFAIVFVAKAVSDDDFKTWTLGRKAKHCLVASIFPISSPRPSQEVRVLKNLSRKHLCVMNYFRIQLMKSKVPDSQRRSKSLDLNFSFSTFSDLPTSSSESPSLLC